VRKLTIIGIFCSRTWYIRKVDRHGESQPLIYNSVSIAIVIHLVFLHRDSTGPYQEDISLGYWRSVVCQQAVQCLSIVTTSLPYAKMFMTSLDSGMIRIDDARRRGEDYSKDSNVRSYELLGISSDGTRQTQHPGRGLEATSDTGIRQTKTWTVESKFGDRSGGSAENKLGLPI